MKKSEVNCSNTINDIFSISSFFQLFHSNDHHYLTIPFSF
uniref:Uncharacterized protein n=1 Tax=Heterorhabditis bacteriophora TaxID=37862 RepID=A0A1I7X2K9_HETBA